MAQAVAGKRTLLGRDHASTLQSVASQADLLLELGQLAEAEAALCDVDVPSLYRSEYSLGAHHPSTIPARSTTYLRLTTHYSLLTTYYVLRTTHCYRRAPPKHPRAAGCNLEAAGVAGCLRRCPRAARDLVAHGADARPEASTHDKVRARPRPPRRRRSRRCWGKQRCSSRRRRRPAQATAPSSQARRRLGVGARYGAAADGSGSQGGREQADQVSKYVGNYVSITTYLTYYLLTTY